MRIVTSGMSDVGCVRASNEDSFGLFHNLDLFVVADGMGGHAAGEVASKMVVDQIESYFRKTAEIASSGEPQDNKERLSKAISYANLQIFKTGNSDPKLNGMGTTVVALLANQEESIVGFVGDSRLYLLRNDTIEQLTHDHSMVNDYVKKGLLTPEAAEHHPQKHVLSRAIGTGPEVAVEVCSRTPQIGDTYLLCSDGLSNKLSSADMCQIVEESEDLDAASKNLIQKAIQAGGEDNITVLLLSYVA
ncbi:MAG: Stp1/IreP family PP2C-type Ser/Thr phosphatase [Nitrospirae bacterium]|nr:Stp1/IreP family PP2C-type Ser/Thr phosphatase [Candidatus Manganitrophaceae bacterium]